MAKYDNRFMLGSTKKATTFYQAYHIPTLHALPRWIGVLEPQICKDLFKITSKADQKLLAGIQNLFGNEENTQGIYRYDRFLPDEEFFFDQWGKISCFIRRTGQYLNWRYFDIPMHNYHCIRCNDEQFVIYRIESIMHHDETLIRIIEWNVTGAAAKKALAFLIEEGKKVGSVLIDFFCTASEIGEELIQYGFFKEKDLVTPIPYLFRPIVYNQIIDRSVAIDLPPHRKPKSFDFGEWYITRGDSDLDRIKL